MRCEIDSNQRVIGKIKKICWDTIVLGNGQVGLCRKRMALLAEYWNRLL